MKDTSLETSLGADLRALRRARGTTLAELAGQVGRSVGWLSQVEREISRPSISELRQLASCLDVPLSLFFGQSSTVAGEEGRIVRASNRRRIGADASLTEELLSPDLTDPFEMVLSEFAPYSQSHDWVQRDTQEVGYLVSGALTLWISDQQFELEAGDSFRIKGERYRWQNRRATPTQAIWVITPPVY